MYLGFLKKTAVLLLSTVACGSGQRPDGGKGLLQPGAAAPEFYAQDQTGKWIRLSTIAKPVVLYFYPKDETPGCTKEACAFRDRWAELQATGATIFGVSKDDVQSHRAFVEKHHLPFQLLADPEGKILSSYGVRSLFGYAERVTFIIDKHGRIAKTFPDVDPAVHAEQILKTLEDLP